MMRNTVFVSACLLLGVAIVIAAAISARGVPVADTTNLEKLPMIIDGYRGVEDLFSDAVYDELDADTHVYRHYRDSKGGTISLYIGYYGTAKGGRSGHNPEACLPGAGWAILDSGSVDLRPIGRMQETMANYMLASRDGTCLTVLHWYQSDGDKVLVNGVQQNIQRFVSKLFHNRNDGAFVRITTSSSLEDVGKALEQVKGFADVLISLLPKYWPVEI